MMVRLLVFVGAIFWMNNLAIAQWQVDSIMMGTASGNDVFYSLKNGTIKTEPNRNWHLAFSMSAGDSAAIWANHNTGNSFVQVYNIHKTFADWSSVTIADTAGSQVCYNWDKGWHQGALNDLPRPSVFSFGWGTYNMASHNVIGDSMFIIKADTNYFKVFIHSLTSIPMDYVISVENLNGGTLQTDTISRGTMYTDRNFAYYDLSTLTDMDREPAKNAWELVFNRYNTLATQGSVTIPYSVIGALQNKGVQVSRVPVVHVDSAFAHYNDHVSPWPANSKVISNVGYDWKVPPTGPPPATWTLPDSLSYFIEDLSGNLYQLQFTGYSGTGSGKIYLRKRMVVPTAVTDINNALQRFEIFPNPASANLQVMLDMQKSDRVNIQVLTVNGQTVYKQQQLVGIGMQDLRIPTVQLASGHYILSIQGNHTKLSQSFLIRH